MPLSNYIIGQKSFLNTVLDMQLSMADFVVLIAIAFAGLAAFLIHAYWRARQRTANRFKFLLILQSLGLALLLAVVLSNALITFQMDKTLAEVLEREGENDTAFVNIIHLDEVLTMSALMGAATGNPRWEERYNMNAPLLDRAIETARTLYQSQKSEKAVIQINEANVRLVAMEQEAFRLAGMGRQKEALALLESSEYIQSKKIYAEGLSLLTDAFHHRTDENFSGVIANARLMLVLLVAGVVALGVKIVALRQTRRALEYLTNARAFSQAVIDAIPDPIFVRDGDHHWRMGNRAHDAIMGGANSFVSEAERQQAARVIAMNAPHEHEGEVRCADGRVISAVASMAPLVLPDGTPGIVGIIHDITALKTIERELAAHRDTLERRVAEQTAVLAREREELRAAKETAETSNRTKSEFLANMSHELRTPLNSIIGLAQLMRDTPMTDDQRDMLSTVTESSSTLLDIVNDILDLSKIESGHLELESVSFDACKAVTRVVNMIAPSASKKGLEVNFHFRGGDMRVKGDPVRFMRVVTNLVGNAMKYTHEGGVDVFLMAATGQDGTIRIDVDVKDTGIGIPQDKLESIFEKFTQADTSTTRKYGGSGLGLAITRHLVQMMRGRIWVKSEVGKGSTFSFSIPFPPAGGEAEVEVGGDFALQGGTMPPGQCRVLVAEDHALNQTFIRRLLPTLGITQFTIVDNGILARDAALSGDYDLVMMDCHMPQMNGYDATRGIRAGEDGTGRRIPIVAMTANAMMGEKEKCLACGMDDYVSKPVNRERFVHVLSRWIQFQTPEPGSGVPQGVAGAPSAPSLTDASLPAVLDLDTIRSYSEGDKEMEREFAQIFFTESFKHIAALRELCVDGVSQEWKEKAHLLKGGSATMGAMKMRALCATAQDGVDATAAWRRDILKEIEAAFIESCQELRKLELLDEMPEERGI